MDKQFLWVGFCGLFAFIIGIGSSVGGFIGAFGGQNSNVGLIVLGVIGVLLLCIGIGSLIYAGVASMLFEYMD